MDIKNCIEKAIRGESNLTNDILAIDGMSSAQNRHLLNNIGAELGSLNYLEVGVHKGSTFVSSLFGNNINRAIAIDDWSQFNNQGQVFKDNCSQFGIKYEFIESSCFNVNPHDINNINFYLYDGNHYRSETEMGITHFYESYANEFVYVVDDYDWDEVREGTKDGIKKCGLKVKKYIWLPSEALNDANSWWNGLGIFILQK